MLLWKPASVKLTPPDRNHTYISTDEGPTLQQQVRC